MTTVYFDEVEVGDELPGTRFTLTSEEVRGYACVAHMKSGRFLSDEAARADGLPGQIAPGNMSMALFSRVLTNWGEGVRLRRLNATFRQLVRPNVPLVIHGVVTEKHASDHGSFIECDLLLESEDGDRLVTGTATLALPVRG